MSVAIVHSRALAGVDAPRGDRRSAPRRRACRASISSACPTPRCAKRAIACAPRCTTRSSNSRRASPSTSRRPTCRRSRAASTCRSRSASSPRAGRFRRTRSRRYEFAGELALTGELRADARRAGDGAVGAARRPRVRAARGSRRRSGAGARRDACSGARSLLAVCAHLAGAAPLPRSARRRRRAGANATRTSPTCAARRRPSARSKSRRRAAHRC